MFLHSQDSNNFNINDYKKPLTFIIGSNDEGKQVEVCINDLTEFDSRNIAIAGMAGSGKTQLIKDILFQISKNTNNGLKFIFFDYKTILVQSPILVKLLKLIQMIQVHTLTEETQK